MARQSTRPRHLALWAWVVMVLMAHMSCAAEILDSQSNEQPSASARTESVQKIEGDIGFAIYHQSSFTQGNNPTNQALPYAYFDYGRYFARIDTFGIKTIPLGMGSLELIGKYSQEGFTPKNQPYSALGPRDTPVPLGLGTFQLTPVGAFFVYAFNDFAASKGGKVAEVTYAAQVDLPLSMHLYPLLGVEYKDSKYNNYFYGVSATDATRSGVAAYSAGAGTSPFGALMIETPLNPEWSLNTYLKRKWLSNSIANSPLVSERTVDNIFVSISRHFE